MSNIRVNITELMQVLEISTDILLRSSSDTTGKAVTAYKPRIFVGVPEFY